jgi:hypothetical protein
MEPRRMPFPTAWLTPAHVGAARNQGSNFAACTYPQVRGVLWRSEFNHRQICARHVRRVQCRNVQDISQEIIAAPFPRQANGSCLGQRPIPPRCIAHAAVAQIPRHPTTAVPAAVQSTTRPHRKGLETCSAHCNPQPVFRHIERSAHRHRKLLRSLAKA